MTTVEHRCATPHLGAGGPWPPPKKWRCPTCRQRYRLVSMAGPVANQIGSLHYEPVMPAGWLRWRE